MTAFADSPVRVLFTNTGRHPCNATRSDLARSVSPASCPESATAGLSAEGESPVATHEGDDRQATPAPVECGLSPSTA